MKAIGKVAVFLGLKRSPKEIDAVVEKTGFAAMKAKFNELNAARLVLFVATGASKAAPLRRAFADPPDVPAGLVVGEERTVWLVDEPAAAEVAEAEAAAVENLYG